MLLAVYYVENGTDPITMPTGFTSVLDANNSAGSPVPRLRFDWKIADGTEGSTLTWSWSTTRWRVGVLFAIQGAQTSGTAVELGVISNNGNAAAVDPPNVQLSGNATVDDLVILASVHFQGATWSAPASWTLQFNGAGDNLGVASIAQAAGGRPAAAHVTENQSTSDAVLSAILAIKAPSGGGGTTFTLSGSTTQTQSLSIARRPSLVRALTQTQTVLLSRLSSYVRSGTTTQSTAAALVSQARLSRAVTQAQALAIATSKVFLRTVSLTQGQSLSIVAQKVFLRTVSLTQGQSVTLRKQVSRTLGVTQAQSVALVRRLNLGRSILEATAVALSIQPRLNRALTQAQAASLAFLRLGTNYPITRSITQATAASIDAHRGAQNYLITVSAIQRQSASLVRVYHRHPSPVPPSLQPGLRDTVAVLTFAPPDSAPELVPGQRSGVTPLWPG